MSETDDIVMMMKWGTWEELLLGGAVLRHGNQAWDAVAAEIRSRTLYPYFFTAEVCKAKYEDLRERYCGCNAWFEELRKRRVAELKRELEKSDDSIGSLETKLESLKGEKGDEEEDCKIKYDHSNRTESPVSDGSTERIVFSGKDTSNSKDGLSAGSFTEEIRTIWSYESQIPANVSTHENKIKPEEIENKKTATRSVEIMGGNLRKRRGKRKRKDCSNNQIINNKKNNVKGEAKEGSVGDSDVLNSADHAAVINLVEGNCDQMLRYSDGDDRVDTTTMDERGNIDLMEILNSFMENEKDNSAVFRCRLDSQKRARYKKMIRCHLDFNTIRSRIIDRSITTDRQLFRDLLLLSNNALVFYPKSAPEYVAAMSLRDLAFKTFREDRSVSISREYSGGGGDDGEAVVIVMESPACNPPPVKLPRSIRPRNRKVIAKVNTTQVESPPPPPPPLPLPLPLLKRESSKKVTPCEIEVPLVDSIPLVASKKGRVRAGKIGGRSSCSSGGGGGGPKQPSETPPLPPRVKGIVNKKRNRRK